MIGLWMSEKPCARNLACEIHNRLRVSIHNQKEKWDLSSSDPASSTHWPISTYQGILLNTIFALLKDDASPSSLSLSLKRSIQDVEYAILIALTCSCRRQRMFHYPTMLQHYSDTGSTIYAWTFTEEIKRFGLGLYRVPKLCCPLNPHDVLPNEYVPPLLTLADLQFSLPASDYIWTAESNAELTRRSNEDGKRRANDEGSWIANVSRFLQVDAVAFEWI